MQSSTVSRAIGALFVATTLMSFEATALPMIETNVSGGAPTPIISDPLGPASSGTLTSGITFNQFTFAIPIDNDERAFGVASIDVSGAAAAEVNGIFGAPAQITATASWSEIVDNNGAGSIPVALQLEIPAAEMIVFDQRGVDPLIPGAMFGSFEVVIKTTRNSAGTLPSVEFPFRYFSSLRGGKSGFAQNKTDNVVGLQSASDPVNDLYGQKAPQLATTVDLGLVGVNETMLVEYTMTAFMSTGVPETGVRVSIGDPLDLSTAGSLDLLFDAPRAAPEPATVVLFGFGLATIFFVRKQKRCMRSVSA